MSVKYNDKREFDETYLRRIFENDSVISDGMLSCEHAHAKKLTCITGMTQFHGGNMSQEPLSCKAKSRLEKSSCLTRRGSCPHVITIRCDHWFRFSATIFCLSQYTTHSSFRSLYRED